ncbi:D-serine ammonia-lyase [Telmatospirillum siberiense]|uniref:Probable D-serine dehydratase n=1 Tax=Telmatospirillum siberiense TaxID=382514 RepID=A0A2N3PXL8_9PROT|nr:D-serine ammonia-lyase [Telmatospirillum siberiense]PKU25153.1 D-serine ammonia-lyase [Telmatospirillum siberiense]
MTKPLSDYDSRASNTIPAAVGQGVPVVWMNPRYRNTAEILPTLPFSIVDVENTEKRWRCFDPLLARLFAELETGRIDSPLLSLDPSSRRRIAGNDDGAVLVKADHALPITGCIKARGGVYEVLAYAETVALEAGLLSPGENYACLAEPGVRELFAKHSIAVGSTGNLGFSVGVMGRALGFKVEVHMSHDAKDWKKRRLRDIGATVVEHPGDYGSAVAAARASFLDKSCAHFIDDEDSIALFLGYAAAAYDLERQLAALRIPVDSAHPLYVYLPCGVGGAPGGVTFGLKLLFGDVVHPVFVEPVASPCMLAQLATGIDRSVSVYDIGLDNHTAADGLAVARASMLVARTVGELVEAVVTVPDDELFLWLGDLWRESNLRLEPSAASGFAAAQRFCAATPGLGGNDRATHVIWTTGGALLPEAEFQEALSRARALAKAADR